MHIARPITVLIVTVSCLALSLEAAGQEDGQGFRSWEDSRKQQQFADSLVSLSQYFMDSYRCSDALSFLESAYALCQFDAAKKRVEEAILRCQQTTVLIQNVVQVTPVDMHIFSKKDFFLYYPLPDKSWRYTEDSSAIYYPGTEDEVYISRAESDDEIFPMVDGDRKYFASASLPGIGGYDIFYSDWDERLGEWGEPVNMGFPINSSADDFLLINTQDGKYTVFASTRNTAADSVTIYITECLEDITYSNVTDPEALTQLSLLLPAVDLKRVDVHSATGNTLKEDEDILAYQKISSEVVDLQQQISVCTSDAQKEYLSRQLEISMERLERYQARFLEEDESNEHRQSEVEHEVVGTDGVYTFTRKSMGPAIKVVYIED